MSKVDYCFSFCCSYVSQIFYEGVGEMLKADSVKIKLHLLGKQNILIISDI